VFVPSTYSTLLPLTSLTVYLLHAFDYCPHNPVICLSLAIASIGRAMQRQADNRHHLIAQVCLSSAVVREICDNGFLGHGFSNSLSLASRRRFTRRSRLQHWSCISPSRYVQHNSWGLLCSKVRAGLLSHAVKHYKRTLDLIERKLQANPNVSSLIIILHSY
jgi:hypothetical protein